MSKPILCSGETTDSPFFVDDMPPAEEQGVGVDAPSDEGGGGVRQEQRMLPPKPQPGMLNQEMAEAAAKQFKKREKNIQKACAELDNPDAPKSKMCCVIL